MIFKETQLQGAFVIEPERHLDGRGFFARSFCEREFAQHDLATRFPQFNISFNACKGTLRGMHYQQSPHSEAAIVRCTVGAIFDVIVDLRPSSPTWLNSIGVTLTASNRWMLYVPDGFAHGFVTLADGSEVFYQMSAFHEPQAARGLRWDDPSLGIVWPIVPEVISERDHNWPDLDTASILGERR